MEMMVQSGEINAGPTAAPVAWAVAQASKKPGDPCGDGYLLRRDGDVLFLAVVDGVGSGQAAFDAAAICLSAFQTCPGHDLDETFIASHAALKGSRGAAMALVRLDLRARSLIWAAVGDIDGCVLRQTEAKPVASMMQRNGTLGHSFGGAHTQRQTLEPGDLIALSSDGVGRQYRDRQSRPGTAKDFATRALSEFGRHNDDRTVACLQIGTGAP